MPIVYISSQMNHLYESLDKQLYDTNIKSASVKHLVTY